MTVIAFQGGGNASVSGTAASPEQVTALVESADRAAAVADAAEDRAELVAGDVGARLGGRARRDLDPRLRDVRRAARRRVRPAEAERRILYGFVFHEVTTTYLGSSTGLRLRHVQPTGHYGCTGKNAELTNSAWVGGATRDFADVDASQMAADLATRLGWGERRIDLPAGRYDTVLPPTAVSDMIIYAYWRPAPATPTTARACSRGPAAGPASARRSSTGRQAALRPVVRRPGVCPVRGRGWLVGPEQRLRQRAAAGSDRLDRRRTADLPDPDPADR